MHLLITGLPGSGKSTLANLISSRIHSSDIINLDGDHIRKCWPYLGYTSEDRTENQRRLVSMATVMRDSGTVIISSIFPTKTYRDELRLLGFREVLLSTQFTNRPASVSIPDYEYNDSYSDYNTVRLNSAYEIEQFVDSYISTYILQRGPNYFI